MTIALLPSSKLLPATIAAVAIVLGMKVVALATSAPRLDALQAETERALTAAGTTAAIGVIAQARAAGLEAPRSDAPRPGLPQRSPAGAPPTAPAAPVAAPVVAPVSVPAEVARPAALPRPEAAPAAETGSAALDALKLRRSQIEERERQLVQREATVTAADKQLAERVVELLALQAKLQTLENNLKERDEANWSGLVKLYEGMRPREAAVIFNALDKPVLLEILDRMKPAKAGLVIASMEAEKARQATADLASKRTRSTTLSN